ncbi:hypothetical protein [Faecalitalea cylindroides]|uniref:hypothetical protein n=1 Tax=Faecalitalea cylindroides TaxID=39483 RepID=UPI002493B71B|nr:hypothetical protein [Faecalitalea cylindroides]
MELLILLLAWSYSPLLSLTDDLDFSNASLNNKDRWSLRFSFLNLYFGEYLIQIITFNLSEKQPDLYRITNLSDFSNFIISQDKINHLESDLFTHMNHLTEEELLVEKEALQRQLSDDDNRMNLAFNKINIYTTIILGGVPILLTVLNEKIVKFIQNSFFTDKIASIVFILLIYFVSNLVIIILQFISILGFQKSRFSDLKNSNNKKETINWQIYYDWQVKRRKVYLFVSLLKIFQDWFIIIYILNEGNNEKTYSKYLCNKY